MTNCQACEDIGLIGFLPPDATVNDADVTKDDLHFAVCLCPSGQVFRKNDNEGKRVAPQWVLWAARNNVALERMVLIEDAFGTEELTAAGFNRPVTDFNREAAMLAAGKRAKK